MAVKVQDLLPYHHVIRKEPAYKALQFSWSGCWFTSSHSPGLTVAEVRPVLPHLALWRRTLVHSGSSHISHREERIPPRPFAWARRNAVLRRTEAGEGLSLLTDQVASAHLAEGWVSRTTALRSASCCTAWLLLSDPRGISAVYQTTAKSTCKVSSVAGHRKWI